MSLCGKNCGGPEHDCPAFCGGDAGRCGPTCPRFHSQSVHSSRCIATSETQFQLFYGNGPEIPVLQVKTGNHPRNSPCTRIPSSVRHVVCRSNPPVRTRVPQACCTHRLPFSPAKSRASWEPVT